MKKINYILILLIIISFSTISVSAKDKDNQTIFTNNLKENGELVEDNATFYIKGENPNNYLYYSGKLWRVINVNFEKKEFTILSNEIIASIAYNTESSYIESDIRKWLNDPQDEGFLGSLYNYTKHLSKTKWNGEIVLNETDISNTKSIENYVGLLSIYDIMKITDLSNLENSYLNINQSYYLSNTLSQKAAWYISERGTLNKTDNNNVLGIRPVIKIKFHNLKGTGTIDDPYTVIKENQSKLLNERSSGEYLLFNNELYRISYIKNNITTARKLDPITKNNKPIRRYFSLSSSLFNPKDKDNIAYYLNNDYYMSLNLDSRAMLIYSDSNLGKVAYKDSYLLTKCNNNSCNSKSNTIKSRISLMEYGSLISSVYNNDLIYRAWLITPSSTSQIYTINNDSSISNNVMTDSLAIIPIIHLSQNIKIKSGRGTKKDPFIIKLPTQNKNIYTIKALVKNQYKIEDIFKEINYNLNWENTNNKVCEIKNNTINIINNGTCTLKTIGENYTYQINIEAIYYEKLLIIEIILSLFCLISIMTSIIYINNFNKKRS